MEHSRNRDTSMTVAVVEAVSSFEGCEPTALPPLYHAVDTDALEALSGTGREGPTHRIEFAFSDSHVTIEDGGRVVVEANTTTSATRN